MESQNCWDYVGCGKQNALPRSTLIMDVRALLSQVPRVVARNRGPTKRRLEDAENFVIFTKSLWVWIPNERPSGGADKKLLRTAWRLSSCMPFSDRHISRE